MYGAFLRSKHAYQQRDLISVLLWIYKLCLSFCIIALNYMMFTGNDSTRLHSIPLHYLRTISFQVRLYLSAASKSAPGFMIVGGEGAEGCEGAYVYITN